MLLNSICLGLFAVEDACYNFLFDYLNQKKKKLNAAFSLVSDLIMWILYVMSTDTYGIQGVTETANNVCPLQCLTSSNDDVQN